MTVMMPMLALYSLADWYRQLLAESIGKSETRGGKSFDWADPDQGVM